MATVLIASAEPWVDFVVDKWQNIRHAAHRMQNILQSGLQTKII